jgi:hypothetical protein
MYATVPLQPRIQSAIDLAHPAGPDLLEQAVRAELCSLSDRHRRLDIVPAVYQRSYLTDWSCFSIPRKAVILSEAQRKSVA